MGVRGALALEVSICDEKIMAEDQQREHVTTTEARAGATPHMTRYVLFIGTGLVIVLFAIIVLVAS
jgi:hypothetical protein